MIARAVGAHPAYLGLVGSRKRGAAVLGYLAERGLPPSELDRIRVPAGLDLGHTTHEEIAVAILAELVQLRASGSLAPSRQSAPGSWAPSRQSTPASSATEPPLDERGYADEHAADAPAEATDPVCGMTVTADAAHWPLEHDSVTYYFCCAGCRRAFEKERVS
jgi:xanthine dehydrogenase accessory factor